ncbi:sperm receptor for egg jelly-like [Paramisgurnus dabryanus]|uniref:sperm receptor for egg jelly-like n=1 Tax=Paramisgurnus dabryanus TaxID=90735 RepID=UPI003CCFB705
MDRGDKEERTVDLYITAEAVRDLKHKKEVEESDTTITTTSIKPPEHTGSERVKMRSYRSVTVCLVLLCVLLLTAVIVLCVLINTNNQQFNIKTKNITDERDQLLTKYTNITKQRDQLLTKYTNITKERDQLLTNNTILTGWSYNQISLYFISSENKTWTESRRYCRERGADLIIINNREEQDFVQIMLRKAGTNVVWIGLSDSDEEGRWKWVNGSTLTSGVNDSIDKSFIMDREEKEEGTVDLYITAETVRDLKHKKEVEESDTTITKPAEHTDGWIYNQSSLYFISSEWKTWTESRRYCRERGADLIIINNKEEQDFVNITCKEHAWIGFTDIDEEGKWNWVDNITLNSR